MCLEVPVKDHMNVLEMHVLALQRHYRLLMTNMPSEKNMYFITHARYGIRNAITNQ